VLNLNLFDSPHLYKIAGRITERFIFILCARFASQSQSETAIKIGLKFSETNDKNLQVLTMQLSRSDDGAPTFWVWINSAIRTVCLEPVRSLVIRTMSSHFWSHQCYANPLQI